MKMKISQNISLLTEACGGIVFDITLTRCVNMISNYWHLSYSNPCKQTNKQTFNSNAKDQMQNQQIIEK